MNFTDFSIEFSWLTLTSIILKHWITFSISYWNIFFLLATKKNMQWKQHYNFTFFSAVRGLKMSFGFSIKDGKVFSFNFWIVTGSIIADSPQSDMYFKLCLFDLFINLLEAVKSFWSKREETSNTFPFTIFLLIERLHERAWMNHSYSTFPSSSYDEVFNFFLFSADSPYFSDFRSTSCCCFNIVYKLDGAIPRLFANGTYIPWNFFQFLIMYIFYATEKLLS